MSSRIMVDGGGPGDDAPPPPEPAEEQPPPQEAPAREPEGEEPPPEAAGGEPDPFEHPKVKQRLDRLTRESYEAKRQAQALQQQWADLQQQARAAQQPPGTVDHRAQAREEIRQEELIRNFNRACDDLFRKGQEEYGEEMSDAVRALSSVGWADRADALAAVTQLPDGHRVYRELASDLDKAARILTLPPMAMALELAQMSQARSVAHNDNGVVADQAANSNLPPPRASRPIGGTTRAAERPLDKVPMSEFIRRRDRDERRSRIMR